MSWQSYVETQLIEKKLTQGAIAGLDGNIWAKVIFNLPSSTETVPSINYIGRQLDFSYIGRQMYGDKNLG